MKQKTIWVTECGKEFTDSYAGIAHENGHILAKQIKLACDGSFDDCHFATVICYEKVFQSIYNTVRKIQYNQDKVVAIETKKPQ